MFERLRRLTGPAGETASPCDCEASLDGSTLTLDATACPGAGDLAGRPACRATAVAAVGASDLAAIRTVDGGRARDYRETCPALVGAAARFAAGLADDDSRLARRAQRDPLAAATEAAGRTGPAASVARETGLARFADVESYADLLSPTRGLAISEWRVDPTPPPGARLADQRRLGTGATVRRYHRSDGASGVYHLEPVETRLGDDAHRVLARAYEHLASASLSAASRTPVTAVKAVADDTVPTARVARVLRKHCRECGLLRDCFADPGVSDVFLTAPAPENPVRVRVDGETLESNITVTGDGVAALASRFRRESGRGFSRAQPTLDAATTIGDRRVRVAGVTEPVSDGQAFAFRAHDRDVWTLAALVSNDTLSAAAAGLLSVCVRRGAATLVAGPRGSGKTTTLGALLWELPASVRTVVIEDAPELPIAALQAADRDVQGLRATDDGTLSPARALRSALRLGDGALVVGEVRGEEAGVLYEAMRVGANSEAVLGTIHGDGGDEVFERVVSDLGVQPSAFATTDLVVSQETARSDGERARRVRTIEEVVDAEPGSFAALFERTEDGLAATGRIDRGNSSVVASLARPDESYADARAAIQQRAETIATLAATGRTDPGVATGQSENGVATGPTAGRRR